MAWNGIPAKDDPHLKIQAYYARLNILGSLLGPFSRDLLVTLWDIGNSRPMREFYRSALIGDLASDLIRAFALDELTNFDPSVGDWFVHCGETYYPQGSGATRLAQIRLRNANGMRWSTAYSYSYPSICAQQTQASEYSL